MPRGRKMENKSHCINGHEYDDKNTLINNKGYKVCKKCARKSVKRWEEKNLERYKAYHVSYRNKNPNYLKEWKEKNPDKVKQYKIDRKGRSPAYHLRFHYGLSLVDLENMKKEQNYCCKICGKDGKLVVDHCHITEKVRGLLCHNCNTALGKFKDSPQLLTNAMLYLVGQL